MSFQIPGEYDNDHVDIPSGERILFIRGISNKFDDQYIEVLYNGPQYKLLKDYYVTIGKQTAQVPGKTITTERFTTQERYYILGPEELTQINLRAKRYFSSCTKW